MKLQNPARLRRDECGATAIEYGLILAMIALAIMAAVGRTGNETGGMWNRVSDDVEEAMG